MPYNKFSKNEFERIFFAVDPDFTIWTERIAERDYSEYIYSADISNGFKIVLYSSVSVKTDKARAKDSDSIRVNLFHEDVSRAVASTSKTLRTNNWMVNLQSKINSLIEMIDGAVQCDECGRYLIEREGKNGHFMGCIGYPECKIIENIN